MAGVGLLALQGCATLSADRTGRILGSVRWSQDGRRLGSTLAYGYGSAPARGSVTVRRLEGPCRKGRAYRGMFRGDVFAVDVPPGCYTLEAVSLDSSDATLSPSLQAAKAGCLAAGCLLAVVDPWGPTRNSMMASSQDFDNGNLTKRTAFAPFSVAAGGTAPLPPLVVRIHGAISLGDRVSSAVKGDGDWEVVEESLAEPSDGRPGPAPVVRSNECAPCLSAGDFSALRGDVEARVDAVPPPGESVDASEARALSRLQADPGDWQAWQVVGNCRYSRGNAPSALEAWSRSLAINPANTKLKSFADRVRADSAQRR